VTLSLKSRLARSWGLHTGRIFGGPLPLFTLLPKEHLYPTPDADHRCVSWLNA